MAATVLKPAVRSRIDSSEDSIALEISGVIKLKLKKKRQRQLLYTALLQSLILMKQQFICQEPMLLLKRLDCQIIQLHIGVKAMHYM